MKNSILKLFSDLQGNDKNFIVYYLGNQRIENKFSDLYKDLEYTCLRLAALGPDIKSVAIIGPTSYEWLLIDLACIKTGILSIAIPENLPENEILDIIETEAPDLILSDAVYINKFKNDFSNRRFFYFNDIKGSIDEASSFNKISILDVTLTSKEILDIYSIAFSSGTSGKIKRIPLSFNITYKKPFFIKRYWNQVRTSIRYYSSFWSRKDNKVIIYMPFSHLQQRSFLRISMQLKINIVLSDPKNCVKHLIMEKPNIMVSVPLIYEIMATNIKARLAKFEGRKKKIFDLYTLLKINSWSNYNPIKKYLSEYLFSEIKKIYGGKADYFITGSAPVNPETIRIFYSVGIKILQAYGQSEVGSIAMSSSRNFKIGSVGKPIQKVIIGDDSEILVKYDEDMHFPQKEILRISKNGYIHTGDYGYLDKQGFLFIQGRLDDVIVLKNGKKVFPENITNKIMLINGIKQAVCLEKNDKISLVLTLSDKKISEKLVATIKEVNQSFPPHAKVSSFLTVPEFSVENDLLTSTFKIKRNKIKELYKDEEFIPIPL